MEAPSSLPAAAQLGTSNVTQSTASNFNLKSQLNVCGLGMGSALAPLAQPSALSLIRKAFFI